jgi:hypothetical protein
MALIRYTRAHDVDDPELLDYYEDGAMPRGYVRWVVLVVAVLIFTLAFVALAYAQDDGFEWANGQPVSSIGRTIPEPIGTDGDVR